MAKAVSKSKENDKSKSWKKPFMEIALRAIRKVHLEYGIWSIGQNPNGVKSFENINTGSGIEMAYESSVCATISHEFINSRFTNGNLFNDRKRYYEFDREVKISYEEHRKVQCKQVDIFINRYMVRPKKELWHYRYPVLIEAKRAHPFTPNPITGKPEAGDINERIKLIITDIKKLLLIRKRLKKKMGFEVKSSEQYKKYKGEVLNAFLYVLCWGICPANENLKSNENSPLYLRYKLNEAGYNKLIFDVRWLPMQWDNHCDVDANTPSIENYLWMTLIEIDPIKPVSRKDDMKEERWIIQTYT